MVLLTFWKKEKDLFCSPLRDGFDSPLRGIPEQ